MREKIEEKLKELGEEVYYGGGRFKDRETWDCIVFGKRKMKASAGTNTQIWFAAIVKEECIPKGLEDSLIQKMREAGMKRADTAAVYDYTAKSGECMVEICTMEFFRSSKGCC
ncbi:MAG: hypothetical protein ACLS9Q_08095 [[Clostridium] scindens]|uniref:hypothetical protein n=1 Tax=Clostridium scindens (strain JCM 10418 / VPI 12708) TaxID=29347 RepID=UPI0039932ABC